MASCSTTVEAAATAVLPATAFALQVATAAHLAACRPAVGVGSTPGAEPADAEDLDGAGDGAGEVGASARNPDGKCVQKPARVTVAKGSGIGRRSHRISSFVKRKWCRTLKLSRCFVGCTDVTRWQDCRDRPRRQ
ncbi:hypothetical protein DFJ73DRAFT_858807 [Zopfochytrium polystomum]|nr:hypothetical protein DFJ73DRAFT_858807 [Zopfochytrium polystomum]